MILSYLGDEESHFVDDMGVRFLGIKVYYFMCILLSIFVVDGPRMGDFLESQNVEPNTFQLI